MCAVGAREEDEEEGHEDEKEWEIEVFVHIIKMPQGLLFNRTLNFVLCCVLMRGCAQFKTLFIHFNVDLCVCVDI